MLAEKGAFVCCKFLILYSLIKGQRKIIDDTQTNELFCFQKFLNI